YPALARLERQGLLRARWESHAIAQRDGRPPRKYYQITPGGKQRLVTESARIRAVERTLPRDLSSLEGAGG
ncbi:MAG: PadR family transcriptional regulator, partial [Gemmatimonadetes bacterium]|nr:PadR family transcriptional regulator [Gemmatimonadota bacterium]